jgi:hypothetical protein
MLCDTFGLAHYSGDEHQIGAAKSASDYRGSECEARAYPRPVTITDDQDPSLSAKQRLVFTSQFRDDDDDFR